VLLTAGGPARGPREIGHDGVAVTPSKDSFTKCRFTRGRPAARSAAVRCLLAAVLVAATASVALAQTSQPPVAVTPAAPAAGPTTPAALQAAPAGALPALPPQPPPVAAPLAPAPAEKHGFLNDIGQWWDQSIADFKAKMKEQQGQIDTFNKQSADAAKDAATATGQAMKNAADAMTHFSHVIEIQETCPVAGNGAADCATTATNVCKGKGYKAGEPLDVRTAEKCTASLWVSGQPPAQADCPVETVLLRAACQ
jgi:hypothetical protein